MLLKISYGKEIHLYNGDLCLQTIIDFTKRTFKTLPKCFRFTYVDQQGDQIMLATSEELQMSYSYHSGKLLKLYVQEEEQCIQNPQKAVQEQKKLSILQKEQDSLIIELSKKFVQDLSQNAMEKVLEKEQMMMKQAVSEYIQELNCQVVEKFVQEEENMFKQISSDFIRQMNKKAAEKCIKDQEDMIKQLSSDFINKTNQRAVQAYIKEQQDMIKQIASSYKRETNQKVVQNCIRSEKKQDIIHNGLKKHQFKKTISLEDRQTTKFQVSKQELEIMIDMRIKFLMPSIVDKVTKAVQKKIMKMSCVKCQKSQLSVEKLINKKLMQKCALKRCE